MPEGETPSPKLGRNVGNGVDGMPALCVGTSVGASVGVEASKTGSVTAGVIVGKVAGGGEDRAGGFCQR